MASSTLRTPEQFRESEAIVDDFHVNELASDRAGALSPFGTHGFPWPVEELRYVHPSPADRPNLADGR